MRSRHRHRRSAARTAPVSARTEPIVMPGCEPVSHHADAVTGVLVLHGFTGNPSSMRRVAETMIAAEFDVELPRLQGDGTTLDDMVATDRHDWSDAVADRDEVLTGRTDRVVVVSQSMGATPVLWSALERPDTAGLVCIDPATRLRDADEMAMIDELLDDGCAIVPGEGSDIADPESSDIADDGTPLAPLRSLLHDGVASVSDRFGEVSMPRRLVTSSRDHVVLPSDSEQPAATRGGPVEHTRLEHGCHVATLDHDRGIVMAQTAPFVASVATS